jgi:hypothetical protein
MDIMLGKHELYDLILYDILNCSQCYEFCFGEEKPDQVFFCLAAKAEKTDQRDHVLFRGPLQMLFRMAACDEGWLRSCHDQFPDVTLPSATQQVFGATFGIADIDLANLMGLGLSVGSLEDT